MFVADVENKGNLKDILKKFGKKYNQDSVLFRPKGGKSRLIITRGKKFGNETKDSHATSYGNSTSANYSKVGGRTFSDAIDIDDDWWPEDEEENFMKKETIFKHEMNESVQVNAAMKCLKNRNNHKQLNETSEIDYAQLADDVCASYRGSLSKLDLKDRINYIVKMVAKKIGKTVDALTPQELTAIQKTAKHSVWYVSEQEETEETPAFDERFAYRKDLRNMATPVTKKAYMIIRKEYGDSMWRVLGMDDCDERGLIDMLNYMQKQYNITDPQDLADVQLGRKSIRSFKKSSEEQEESTLSESEIEELAFKLTDYLIESFITLEDEDEDYSKLYEAVEKILKKDAPNPESTKECYAWCKKWYQKIEDLSYSYNNYPNPESYYSDEEEENVYSDILNKIINDGLDYWDVWEMAKQGKATKTELEISGVLLDLFETLMYNGDGQILSKVASGEIDKRELKRIIVDVLMEQGVDTFPSGESEYNSWVDEHNSEIVKRLEAKFNEEQEEHPEDADRLQSQLANAWDEGMEDDVFDPYDNKFDKTYDDVVWKLISAVWHYFEDEADVEGFNIFEFTENQIGKAIEQILDKHDDMPSSRDFKKCYAWVKKHAEEIIKILETGSLENTYEGHPEFDFNEQEEMPQMERRDMILALSEYMSESWIDTGDDGDLDDIYYAIADILDETGDYPASTSWEDCKPWCRKYYKQVEARIQ